MNLLRLAFGVVLLSGLRSVEAVGQLVTPPPAPAPTGSILKAGDILIVRLVPSLGTDGPYRVDPAGMITIPGLLVPVRATGLDLADVREQLELQYRRIVENSKVLLELRFNVTIGGEIPQPGRIEVDPTMQALDVVAMRGDWGPNADRYAAFVQREGRNGQLQTLAMYSGARWNKIYLQSGDQIIIPKKKEPKFTWAKAFSVIQTIGSLAALAGLFASLGK